MLGSPAQEDSGHRQHLLTRTTLAREHSRAQTTQALDGQLAHRDIAQQLAGLSEKPLVGGARQHGVHGHQDEGIDSRVP